jgi:bacteriocin-like protein
MTNDEKQPQTSEEQLPTAETELSEEELEQVNGGAIDSYRPVALKIEVGKILPTDQKSFNFQK